MTTALPELYVADTANNKQIFIIAQSTFSIHINSVSSVVTNFITHFSITADKSHFSNLFFVGSINK